MNQDKKHLATVSILIKDRHSQATDINNILSEHGNLIFSRLGVNVQRRCVEHCMAIIVVVVEGSSQEIRSFTRKLDTIYGIVAKSQTLTE